MLDSVIDFLNGLLWGKVLIYLLVGAGLFFTLRLGFIQMRYFKHGFTVLKQSQRNDAGLSSFEVFCTSMAARVGTGNMAGVAVAIVAGGPGAVFWMWLIAVLGMATSMIESTLAQVYKVKDGEGKYRGGPAYYMEQGLGKRWMGILFSICLIFAFGFAFNAVQANTITDALFIAFEFDKMWVAAIVVVLCGLVISGGLAKVASVAVKVVPVMAVGYIFVALIVVAMNISELPGVLLLIVKSAFGLQEVVTGGVAYTIAQAMQSGIARGLFSNEAGMGSAANVAASAAANPNHPAAQGFVQMLGVFFDTLVICSATAAIILLTGAHENAGDLNGIALTQMALTSEVGQWGAIFVAISILLFCFTSIIANYSYAETNVLFLSKNNTKVLLPFRALVLGMVLFGSLAQLQTVWNLADVTMGLMAVVNIVAILLLSGLAVRVIRDYKQQLAKGQEPSFDPTQFDELKGSSVEQVWPSEEGKKA
ncbi:alanine/glycine:cation symporter family protein [Paraferrimonas sedimenticola]|uniref:Sodium:alanine symporter n=1 Tax=Paraferrimonas sedimenticola TaxID=375674 RepID=A0AA37RXT5_9GAMM|nr:sodium:alanine symporter family protein [Paraferrimonas sedimenticola]GLP97155.1 sodium:alanine symporter [Paraferrimonas sedimenticola]